MKFTEFEYGLIAYCNPFEFRIFTEKNKGGWLSVYFRYGYITGKRSFRSVESAKKWAMEYAILKTQEQLKQLKELQF